MSYFNDTQTSDLPKTLSHGEGWVILGSVATTVTFFSVWSDILYYRRRNFEFIEKRSPELALYGMVVCLIHFNWQLINFGPVQKALGVDWPCVARLIPTDIMMMPVLLPVTIRTFSLLHTNWSNQYDAGNDPRFDEDRRRATKLRRMFIGVVEFIQFEWLRPPRKHHDENNIIHAIVSDDHIDLRASPSRSGRKIRVFGAFLLSTSISMLLIGFNLGVHQEFWKNPFLPLCAPSYVIPVTVITCLYALSCPPILYNLRKVQDSYRVRRELSILYIIIVGQMLLENTIKYMPGWDPYGWLADLVNLMLFFPLQITQIVWPLVASFIYERDIERLVARGNWESFEKIIHSDRLMVTFRQWLAMDLCIENGLFIEDLRALEEIERAQHLPAVSYNSKDSKVSEDSCSEHGEQPETWRMRLHRKELTVRQACAYLIATYIRESGSRELNIECHTRSTIMRRYRKGMYSSALFAQAKQESKSFGGSGTW